MCLFVLYVWETVNDLAACVCMCVCVSVFSSDMFCCRFTVPVVSGGSIRRRFLVVPLWVRLWLIHDSYVEPSKVGYDVDGSIVATGLVFHVTCFYTLVPKVYSLVTSFSTATGFVPFEASGNPFANSMTQLFSQPHTCPSILHLPSLWSNYLWIASWHWRYHLVVVLEIDSLVSCFHNSTTVVVITHSEKTVTSLTYIYTKSGLPLNLQAPVLFHQARKYCTKFTVLKAIFSLEAHGVESLWNGLITLVWSTIKRCLEISCLAAISVVAVKGPSTALIFLLDKRIATLLIFCYSPSSFFQQPKYKIIDARLSVTSCQCIVTWMMSMTIVRQWMFSTSQFIILLLFLDMMPQWGRSSGAATWNLLCCSEIHSQCDYTAMSITWRATQSCACVLTSYPHVASPLTALHILQGERRSAFTVSVNLQGCLLSVWIAKMRVHVPNILLVVKLTAWLSVASIISKWTGI